MIRKYYPFFVFGCSFLTFGNGIIALSLVNDKIFAVPYLVIGAVALIFCFDRFIFNKYSDINLDDWGNGFDD